MPGKRWSPEETELLEKQWARKSDVKKIRLPGRSSHAIRRKVVRAEIKEANPPRGKPWSEREIVWLKKMVAAGKRATELAGTGILKRRSRDSIAQQIRRLRLVADTTPSLKLRERRRLSGDQKNEFEAAIEQYGSIRHTNWFVWKFAVSRGSVKRAFKNAGKEVGWKEIMRTSQTKALFSRRVSKGNLKSWERRRNDLKVWMVDRLHEIETEVSIKPRLANLPTYHRRKCHTCQAEWFARQDFFKSSHKRLKNGTSKNYLKRQCRLCSFGARGVGHTSIRKIFLEEKQVTELLGRFAESLQEKLPSFFDPKDESLSLRWVPFEANLAAKTHRELVSICMQVISVYQAQPNLNALLDAIEHSHFDSQPTLHRDLWELDELVRETDLSKGGRVFVKNGKLTPMGDSLAIKVYRILTLPVYLKSLV